MGGRAIPPPPTSMDASISRSNLPPPLTRTSQRASRTAVTRHRRAAAARPASAPDAITVPTPSRYAATQNSRNLNKKYCPNVGLNTIITNFWGREKISDNVHLPLGAAARPQLCSCIFMLGVYHSFSLTTKTLTKVFIGKGERTLHLRGRGSVVKRPS